ncbi:hypothetical protein ACJX0J_022178, partial [Zea mays]
MVRSFMHTMKENKNEDEEKLNYIYDLKEEEKRRTPEEVGGDMKKIVRYVMKKTRFPMLEHNLLLIGWILDFVLSDVGHGAYGRTKTLVVDLALKDIKFNNEKIMKSKWKKVVFIIALASHHAIIAQLQFLKKCFIRGDVNILEDIWDATNINSLYHYYW